ncbi:hypothetical protein KFL_000520430 [Klebsormidium nitens]|uniref:GTPase Era n=1 Tax=Klebsormidium nitens TaxID=105231 RepID=A0A1Y1HP15_KLENI|nr:hypothetical protein KFL_000520430 [Klebsormidium nitens]|eukprot:GAQ80370.1 hypothetical protein KFL_000520430 [Klebsormidium nitens]
MDTLNARLPPHHRSGYVAVVGKPNAGKSSLMNQLVGQKVSIVSQKPQTTRHQILGIVSEEEYQVVLFDTPGVIAERRNKLEEVMMRNVRTAMINASAVLAIVDATLEPIRILEAVHDSVDRTAPPSQPGGSGGEGGEVGEEEELRAMQRPLLVVLNKKDLVRPRDLADKVEWYEQNSGADDVIAVSAKYGQGVGAVRQWMLSKMPLGPAYYPKDIVSEHPERFFVAEILREKIFLQYKQEVPYACQVNCVDYKARPAGKDMIYLEIVVEKDNQKGILIGKGGEALKKLAMAARKDIEDFLQKEVFLDLRVSVSAGWREDERLLDMYGFEDIRA